MQHRFDSFLFFRSSIVFAQEGGMQGLTIAIIVLLALIAVALIRLTHGIESVSSLMMLQWRRQRIDELSTQATQEQALAAVLADTWGAVVQVVAGSLRCAAVPTPHIAATCTDGARVFVSQQPRVLRRLGFTRRARRAVNLTRRISLRRAEICALWFAANAGPHATHTRIRSDADWHALRVEIDNGGPR
jgi:hypothetical protein